MCYPKGRPKIAIPNAHVCEMVWSIFDAARSVKVPNIQDKKQS